MVFATSILHVGGMTAGLRWLSSRLATELRKTSIWNRSLVVAVMVLIMFAVTMVEAGAWAAIYLAVGAISGFEKALYFSTVTYTTLGFGDVVLDEQWRLLSSLEAANGIIMFGWTTALIFAAIRHVSERLKGLRKGNQ